MFTKDLLFQNDKGALHHAYLITGDIDENIVKLNKTIEKIIGMDVGGYPDYHLHFTPSFTISDSRDLIERQKTRAFGPDDPVGAEGHRFFVVASYSFNHVAQNGLLKVLEDPIAGNHFFILTTNEGLLLPTLRSRLFHIEGDKLSHDDVSMWCADFVRSDIPGRLVVIGKLLKDEDEDSADKMIKQRVIDIVNGLEKIFSDKLALDNKGVVVYANFLSELSRMRSYLNDTAPARRLIFEYIAFICPK